MITLHHLNASRSFRVVWLLEELGTPYELVRYQREPSMRAPASLAKVHPLGKAPVIEDDGLVIAESAVILDYLNDTYGEGRLAPPRGGRDHVRHEEWLQYAESSAASPIMMTVIAGMIGDAGPNLMGYARQGATRALDYVQAGLEPGPYLMGAQFTLADIQMAYLIAVTDSVGLLSDHAPLQAYLRQLEERPAFKRAAEVGGSMRLPGR